MEDDRSMPSILATLEVMIGPSGDTRGGVGVTDLEVGP